MTHLRAAVRRTLGTTGHYRGDLKDGIASAVRLPDPITIEILEQDGAFFLFRLAGDGQCISDTWHQTLEEAKGQAKFEFDIADGDWKDISWS